MNHSRNTNLESHKVVISVKELMNASSPTMVVSLRRAWIFFLFTLTLLALQCAAFLGDGEIVISFSIRSPTSMSLAFLEEVVTDAIRDFFCQEAQVVVFNSNFRSACIRRGKEENSIASEDEKEIMMDFIRKTDPDRSYILGEASMVRISYGNKRDDDFQWSSWVHGYDVLQLGTKEIGRAKRENFTDGMAYLEDRIQESLDLSIVEGVLNRRFMGTDIIILESEEEIEGRLDNSSIFYEDEERHDFAESARILRYVGIAMLLGSGLLHIVLLSLARRYRRQINLKEVEELDPPAHQKGLTTEEGVNLMLETGRRQSERIAIPSCAQTV